MVKGGFVGDSPSMRRAGLNFKHQFLSNMLSRIVDPWFRDCSVRIVQSLPEHSRVILNSLMPASRLRHVDEGAIVLFTASRYAHGSSPDEVVAHLIGKQLFQSRITKAELLSQFVCPIRAAFCGCQLALPKYWDPHTPWIDFLIYDAALRIEAGEAVSHILEAFKNRWAFTNPQCIIDEAVARLTFAPEAVEKELAWVLHCAQLCKVNEELQQQFSSVAHKLASVEGAYPHLLSFAKVLIGLRYLQTVDHLAISGVSTEMIAKVATLHKWSAALFCWEREWISSKEVLASKMERTLALAPLVIPESQSDSDSVYIGVTAERLNDCDYIPLWIKERVFTMGARFMHASLGPIPYLFVVLESDEAHAAGAQLGIGAPIITSNEVKLPFVLHDDDADPLCFEYHFLVSAAEHLRTLVLIATLASFRFTIFTSDGEGSLSIARSGLIPLRPDLAQTLSRACDAALTEHFGGNPETLRDALASAKDEPLYGFLGMENAKSERLLVDTAILPTFHPNASIAELWRRLGELRASRLELDERRVQALDEGLSVNVAEIVEAIDKTNQQYRQVLQQLRGRDRNSFDQFSGKSTLEDQLQVLEQPSRCFIHLGFKRSQLYACFAFLRDGTPEVEMLSLSDFVLEDAIDSTNVWLSACDDGDIEEERTALDELLHELGIMIGQPLAAALAARNIRDLVICPSWFLELIPIHCLPTHDSGKMLLLDQFDAVAYAPSLNLLHRNRLTPKALKSSVLSFSPSDQPLPWADVEADLVCRVLGCETKLSGADATPQRCIEAAHSASILHCACHGLWDPVDPLRSSLSLSGHRGARTSLTAASLMRGPRLDNLSLVVLSACHSGAHSQPMHTFQEYRGLDGTFLAMGARTVISTLWSIDDFGAMLVTARFYYELKQGRPPISSLYTATQQLRNGYLDNMPEDASFGVLLDETAPCWRDEAAARDGDLRHPASWGAFRCSGAGWRQIENS